MTGVIFIAGIRHTGFIAIFHSTKWGKPVAMFHIRTPSLPQLARLPSDSTAMAATTSVCPRRVRTF